GDGPALARTELAEDFVDRIPAEGVAEAGEDDVLGQDLVQLGEVARDAAPAADDEALGGGVAAQEIVRLKEGGRGERDALLAGVPVGALVLPEPDVIDVGIGGEELVEARIEELAAGVGGGV